MSYRTALSAGCLISLFFTLSGCGPQEDEDRPAAISTGGPGAPAKPTGMGGETTMVADGTAAGSVEMWTNDLFGATTGFTSPSTVFVLSADGRDSVNGEFDGAGFSVEGDVAGRRWVQVRPINDDNALPTLTEADLSGGEVTLPVMQSSVLLEMLDTITTETVFDSNAAQIVIAVVDGSGNPVSGVEADTQAAGPGIISYREEDGIWQNLDDGTNQPGLILIPNVDAPVFPGQDTQVILTGTIDGTEVNVRIVSGTVTFVTVVVP